MKVEVHGIIAIVAMVIGVTLAAVAARSHRWPLGLASGAFLIYSIVSALLVFRRVSAMMRGPHGRRAEPDAKQPGPEAVAGDGDGPGLGCGERRRVDTNGRATRTALDSQP